MYYTHDTFVVLGADIDIVVRQAAEAFGKKRIISFLFSSHLS